MHFLSLIYKKHKNMTVSFPSPPGLEISFLRTGMGVYVPSSNAFSIFVFPDPCGVRFDGGQLSVILSSFFT